MKKIYLSMLLAMFVSVVAAQSPIKFGIQAGVNFAKFNFSGEGVEELDEEFKSVTSFQIGGLVDVPLATSFSLQPGITLSGKGFKVEGDDEGDSFTYQENIMYLEVPVNAVYKVGNIYFGAGPYAAFALSGKYKDEWASEGESESDEGDLEFGSGDDDDYKSGDFGVNVLAGYQTESGIGVGLNYGLGLSNLITSEDDDNKVTNRVFSVSLRYLF